MTAIESQALLISRPWQCLKFLVQTSEEIPQASLTKLVRMDYGP